MWNEAMTKYTTGKLTIIIDDKIGEDNNNNKKDNEIMCQLKTTMHQTTSKQLSYRMESWKSEHTSRKTDSAFVMDDTTTTKTNSQTLLSGCIVSQLYYLKQSTKRRRMNELFHKRFQ